MAVQEIVLAGFGSTGSVSLIVTRGYAGGAPVPPTPTPDVPRSGGVYWQYIGRKKRRREFPSVNEILDRAVSEYYAEIIDSDLPKEAKKEAAAVVRPFVDKRVQGIPTPASVDWQALQENAERVGLLIRIWHEELLARDIDDEDELLLMS
jgi:hypothetical protein